MEKYCHSGGLTLINVFSQFLYTFFLCLYNIHNRKSDSLALRCPITSQTILQMLCLCGEKEELWGCHQHTPLWLHCMKVAGGTMLFS